MDHIYKLVNVSKSRDGTINEILAYLLTVEKSRTELNRSRRGAPADEVAENDAVELELKRLSGNRPAPPIDPSIVQQNKTGEKAPAQVVKPPASGDEKQVVDTPSLVKGDAAAKVVENPIKPAAGANQVPANPPQQVGDGSKEAPKEPAKPAAAAAGTVQEGPKPEKPQAPQPGDDVAKGQAAKEPAKPAATNQEGGKQEPAPVKPQPKGGDDDSDEMDNLPENFNQPPEKKAPKPLLDSALSDIIRTASSAFSKASLSLLVACSVC